MHDDLDEWKVHPRALSTVRIAATTFGRLVIDTILPPRCLSCGCLVGGVGMLCAPCWESMRFISEPCCAACGLPFEYDLGENALCGACAGTHPRFDRARSALVYDDHSRDMILAFKHGDRTDMAPAFARWMCGVGRELVNECDAIVPVPLHRTRLLRRRYNQAGLLAHQIGHIADRPILDSAVQRKRATKPLGSLNAAARRRSLANAFAVPTKHTKTLTGKRILLVDDVFTTGSTVGICARHLKQAGANRVDVLTLARVVSSQ